MLAVSKEKGLIGLSYSSSSPVSVIKTMNKPQSLAKIKKDVKRRSKKHFFKSVKGEDEMKKILEEVTTNPSAFSLFGNKSKSRKENGKTDSIYTVGSSSPYHIKQDNKKAEKNKIKQSIQKEEEEEEEEEKEPKTKKRKHKEDIPGSPVYIKQEKCESPVKKDQVDESDKKKSQEADIDFENDDSEEASFVIDASQISSFQKNRGDVSLDNNKSSLAHQQQEPESFHNGLPSVVNDVSETGSVYLYNDRFSNMKPRHPPNDEEWEIAQNIDNQSMTLKDMKGISQVLGMFQKHIACPVLNSKLYNKFRFPGHYLCIGGQEGIGKRTFVKKFCKQYGVNLIILRPVFTSPHYMKAVVDAASELKPCVVYFDHCETEFMETGDKMSWARQLNIFFTNVYENGISRSEHVWMALGISRHPAYLVRWISDKIKNSYAIIHPPDIKSKIEYMIRETQRLWEIKWEGDLYGHFIKTVSESYSKYASYGDISSFLKNMYSECMSMALEKNPAHFSRMQIGTVHTLPTEDLLKNILSRLNNKELINNGESEQMYVAIIHPPNTRF